MIATINQSTNNSGALSDATRSGWVKPSSGASGLYYQNGNDKWWGTVLYKFAIASDVAASSFSFQGDSDADDVQGSIIAFSGVDEISPFDAIGEFTTSNSDDRNLTASSINTTVANSAVIMLAFIEDNRTFSNWLATSPSTLTELFDSPFDADRDMGIGGAWAIKSNIGPTGDGRVTLNNNARDGAILLALRPKRPASTVTVKNGVADSFTYSGSAQGPGINDFDFTGSTGTKSVLYSGTGSTSYTSATPPTNVGTYQVVVSVATDGTYGTGSSDPFSFSITPKILSITPDEGQFKLIGESDPSSLSYQVSGFEFSDNASLLSGSLVRDAGEAVGFYEIRQGDLSISSSNYTLEFASGIFFEIRSNPTQYLVSVSSQNPKKGTSITVSAQLADVNGSAIPESGRVVTWAELSGVTGSFGASTSVTDASGIATVQFTVSNQVGVSTAITASGSGGLFGTSPIVTTVDSAPTQLVFLQAPSGTTEAGQPFAQQPIIEIQDADGNRVESANSLVFLSLASGTGELRGEVELQAINGQATFTGLNIDLVGDDKAILAEADGLTSTTSNPFSISAGPSALFTRYAGIQQVAAIGTAVTTPPAVRVQDIFGNPISGVSVSFEVTSGGGSIQPTTAVLTDLEGIAALSSWTLGPDAGSNTVVASASDFTSLTFTALGSEDAIVEFTSNATWVVPPGVTSIFVEAWGGGGAGGGVNGSRSNRRVGGGGGGGAYAKKILTVTPGEVLSLNVGLGGSTNSANIDGPDGQPTYIQEYNDQIFAAGGIGGLRTNGSNDPASGGAGGSESNSIGDLVRPGQNGTRGGENASTQFNGAGGDAGLENTGASSKTTSGDGNTGGVPGGGGSGAFVNGDRNDRIGGAGGSGKIIITYPKPVNQFRAASSGNWEDNATWEQQFSNGQFAKIDSKPSSNSTVLIAGETIKVTISDDLAFTGTVIINSLGELSLASGKNLSLNSGATLTLGNEGILSLPADGFIQGAGNIAINKGGTLAIAHPDGIKASGASGAIQNSGTRSFSPEANYLYNGSQPQTVGDGLPPVVNSLIIDNISGVTLDKPLEVTLDLVMNAGALELDQSLMVDLGMTLNGSSQVVVKEGVSFTADLLSNLTTNQTSRIVLQPGAKYSNLGVSSPRLEVQQLLTGVKGWRMLGSPVTGATYLNFLSGLESQGFTGSTNPSLQPNVLWWDETDGGTTLQGWRQPANISQEVPNGRGHYVYVFNGGSKASGGNYTDNLPLTLSALGTEFNLNTGGFDFGVTYTPRNENFKGDAPSGTYTQVATANEGFNLIANPTASFIDFFNEAGWTKDKIDETIYIWDQNFNNGQGDFLEITADTPQAERLIAPYQGFWVRTSQENPSLVMSNEAKSFASSLFYGRIVNEEPASQASKIKLSVQGEGLKANASLRISDQGEDGIDPWDAFQLESLNSTWLNLYSLGSPQQTDPLVINHLSLPKQGEKTVPLYLAAAKEGKPFSGTYTLNWELPAEWPTETRVVLMDHISQKAIDMSQIQSYEFSFEAPTSTNMRIRTEEGGMKQPQAVVFSHEVVDGQGENFRTNSGQITRPFTIVIGYTGEGANPEYRPEQPKLYAPSPNPFVDRTQIKFYLPVEDSATVKIYDLKGQEVGAFEQQVYPAGIHTLNWEPNAIRLPKGVYLIHVVTSNQVLIQKALKF
ncbi:MBG domain-containing protein [Algoriphagus sanaruensis]|nr:MBG domain-containing protein [Algoriphagus sanaruensis]